MIDDDPFAVLVAERMPGLNPEPGAASDDPLPEDVVDLLHCLGFIYLRHGQATRAMVLLMLAARGALERTDILRTLAAAMIGAELADQALVVLDRICALDPAAAGHRMVALMRARALLLQGHVDEARTLFRAEVAPAGSTP